MANKGYRMIDNKAFLLNGTVSGWTPVDAKTKALAEAKRIRAKGTQVRLIKYRSTIYQVWTF